MWVHEGSTREDRTIDRLFCRMTHGLVSSGTVSPLDPGDEEDNSQLMIDYWITHPTPKIQRVEAFEWLTYSYRQYLDEAQDEFGGWLITHNWINVIIAQGSDEKAMTYQKYIDEAMYRFFPLWTVKEN